MKKWTELSFAWAHLTGEIDLPSDAQVMLCADRNVSWWGPISRRNGVRQVGALADKWLDFTTSMRKAPDRFSPRPGPGHIEVLSFGSGEGFIVQPPWGLTVISGDPYRAMLADAAKAAKKAKAAADTSRTTYLIGDTESGRIKIGYTDGPVEQRLAALQTGNAARLVVLATRSGDHEKALHDRFAAQRLGGEWFGLSALDICRALAD